MEAFVIEKKSNTSLLIEIFILSVNWVDFYFRFSHERKRIVYFDASFNKSTESKLLKLFISHRLNYFLNNDDASYLDNYHIPLYEDLNSQATIRINNQRFIKNSDELFFKILKSDKFQELLDIPLDVIFKREATVEWVLKELGCDSNIEYIINTPLLVKEGAVLLGKKRLRSH